MVFDWSKSGVRLFSQSRRVSLQNRKHHFDLDSLFERKNELIWDVLVCRPWLSQKSAKDERGQPWCWVEIRLKPLMLWTREKQEGRKEEKRHRERSVSTLKHFLRDLQIQNPKTSGISSIFCKIFGKKFCRVWVLKGYSRDQAFDQIQCWIRET